MSLATRVIPCLDVAAGRVVKGVNFTNLADAGDPVELAHLYGEQGADELTFLDISASVEARATTYDMVARCAEEVFIPLTVGGGISHVDDVDRLLRVGADKISINTAAVRDPGLIDRIAGRFGNQVLVLSVDAARCLPDSPGTPSGYEITTMGGRTRTGIDALDWMREATERGTGEILLNSVDADGTKAGFDLEMVAAARAVVDVPLIASGGAGGAADFAPAVEAGADAVLAASIFHFRETTIAEVKTALRDAGCEVR